MRDVPERHNHSLIPRSAPLCVRMHRIDGSIISDWPATLSTDAGQLLVNRDGSTRLRYDPATAARLDAGASRALIEFTYTLTDDVSEFGPYKVSATIEATAAGARRGWTADWDSGLESGDYFVDAVRGSDGNSGRSIQDPFKSIQAGIDAMARQGGNTLLIRGGRYPGGLRLEGLQGNDRTITVSRYRGEQPVISGAEQLGGLRQCDSSHASYLGSNFAQVLCTELTLRDASNDRLEALGVCERQRPLALASDLAMGHEPFLFGSVETFHKADRFFEQNEKIVGISHNAALSRYTDNQLENAVAVIWGRGNRLSRVHMYRDDSDRAGYVGVRPAPDVYVAGDQRFWRYAVLNSAPALRPGTWCYRRQSTGEAITLYIWPFDRASELTDFHFADRDYGMDIGTVSNLRLQGLAFEDFGGSTPTSGIAFGNVSGGSRKVTNHKISVHQCRFARAHSPIARYGVVHLSDVKDLGFTNCQIETSQNSGLFLSAATGVRVEGCLLRQLTHNALMVFDTQNAIFAFSDMLDVARVAHTNVANFYGTPHGQRVDKVLLYALRVSGANGYITWQGASRVDIGFCDISPPILRNDVRSVVDQHASRSVEWPAPGQTSYIWNNVFRHRTGRANERGDVLSLGQPGVAYSYAVINNIIGGGGIWPPYGHSKDFSGQEFARLHNLYTNLSWWQAAPSDWRLDPTEEFYDQGIGLFDRSRPGEFILSNSSALLHRRGFDMDAITNRILGSRYPGFDFSADIDGFEFSWKDARLGPFQMDWNLQIR